MTRCSPPALGVKEQTAAGNDAMQVIVVEQGLAPSVQHGSDADLRFEVVAAELQQRGRYGVEQQVVKAGAVLLDQVIEIMRQREYEMEVGNGQELFGLPFQPVMAVGPLAGGTMPVPARMRNEVIFAAMAALIMMPAQNGRAAGHDGAQNFPMVMAAAGRCNTCS